MYQVCRESFCHLYKRRGSMDSDTRFSILVNYGLIMRLSYLRTRAVNDLNKALEVTREALKSNLRPGWRRAVQQPGSDSS